MHALNKRHASNMFLVISSIYKLTSSFHQSFSHASDKSVIDAVLRGISLNARFDCWEKAKKIIEACNQSGAVHYVVEFGGINLPNC